MTSPINFNLNGVTMTEVEKVYLKQIREYFAKRNSSDLYTKLNARHQIREHIKSIRVYREQHKIYLDHVYAYRAQLLASGQFHKL